MKTTPYWSVHDPRVESQNVALPLSADVVGGGFIGLCTALSLVKNGASVVVIGAGV